MSSARTVRTTAGLVLVAACAGGAVVSDPDAALELAERSLDPAPEKARTLLETLDPDALIPSQRERYEVAYADALFRTGEAWDGFEQIRNFVEQHRFSDLTGRVQELQFRIGSYLIQSDHSWLFGCDADDGETVLREFVERFAANPHVADALRLLGGYAYDSERWSDAVHRFEQILREHPDSEWVPLAAFRRAMAIHAQLLGPEYDLSALLRARNELRDFLASNPERPEFREQAGTALAEVEDWIARRHLLDADFYHTVGNAFGERYYLQLLVTDSAGHPLVEVAEQRLRELGPAPGSGGSR